MRLRLSGAGAAVGLCRRSRRRFWLSVAEFGGQTKPETKESLKLKLKPKPKPNSKQESNFPSSQNQIALIISLHFARSVNGLNQHETKTATKPATATATATTRTATSKDERLRNATRNEIKPATHSAVARIISDKSDRCRRQRQLPVASNIDANFANFVSR